LGRRLRAAAVLAGLWSIPWALGGALVGYNRIRHGGFEFDWVNGVADVRHFVASTAIRWGAIGAVNGTIFAGVLSTLGRRAAPEFLTWSRVTGWGALAGLVIPTVVLVLALLAASDPAGLWPAVLIVPAAGACLGALCAVATFAIAGGRSHRAAES
jgi:hypothetical protein